MASLNRCSFIGNLTRDPEVKFLTNGEAVANCSIAVNESWKDKNGDKQERVEFVNITFYRRLAEIAGEYLKKGSLIYVEGRITTEKWTDKEGKERYTTKIVANEMKMLSSKSSGAGSFEVVENQAPARSAPAAKPAAPAAGPSTGSGQVRNFDNFDDDIPF